jgi:hypothetical protein
LSFRGTFEFSKTTKLFTYQRGRGKIIENAQNSQTVGSNFKNKMQICS